LITSKSRTSDRTTSPARHPIGTGADRRRRCRAKVVGRVHARGGVGTLDLFEDVGKSIDVSLDGVLWSTSRGGYWVGQFLEVTFPYWTSPTAINQARRARVVRNLLLPDSSYAVAVEFDKGASVANGVALTARRPDQVRVLGVEADPSIANALRLLFEQDGYQVVLVSTGQQALDILESDTPDVLIAEADGMGITGRELCAIAKKNLRLRHIPVILLTNSALPSDYSASYRAGAVVCMMRPCEPQRLRNAVHMVAPPPGQRSAYSAAFNMSAFVRTS
jgi:CheY-like chemotaxis protein